jgi:GNAT superfamily N-acetyltransferase
MLKLIFMSELSHTQSLPGLWQPDAGDETHNYQVEEARIGDGRSISLIHGLAMISDYPHPRAREPSLEPGEDWIHGCTTEAEARFVCESLWKRKPPEYWDECIAATLRGDGPYEKIWVTRLGGRVTGFATTVLDGNDFRFAELDAAYVHPADRRKRMGSFLVRKVLEQNEQNGRITHAAITQWIPGLGEFYLKHCQAEVVRSELDTDKANPHLQYGITLRQSGVVVFGKQAWLSGEEERVSQTELVRELYAAPQKTPEAQTGLA